MHPPGGALGVPWKTWVLGNRVGVTLKICQLQVLASGGGGMGEKVQMQGPRSQREQSPGSLGFQIQAWQDDLWQDVPLPGPWLPHLGIGQGSFHLWMLV